MAKCSGFRETSASSTVVLRSLCVCEWIDSEPNKKIINDKIYRFSFMFFEWINFGSCFFVNLFLFVRTFYSVILGAKSS